MKFDFSEFTLDKYKQLLFLAKEKYQFTDFKSCMDKPDFIVWRHDIDFSMHAAARIAKIEKDMGVQATYFLHLHNDFYNLLEKNIAYYVGEIIAAGHHIGLHFDASYYDSHSESDLEKNLQRERRILEEFFDVSIDVFSFHNPNEFTRVFQNESYANMINTYSRFFSEQVGYCSDSNGYWRFTPLEEILNKNEHQRLQVLTHPAWWTLTPMSPKDRIAYCIDGRARKQHLQYDELLEKHGRLNVKA